MNDPADKPAALNTEAAVVPVMMEPPVVPKLPTKGASKNVKLLVAEATEVAAELARLTNHETLLVAFWVNAVRAEPACRLIDVTLTRVEAV